ncbi:hypothetical protein QWI17_15025 [Gilvimarinus sp. SDUM040013]|uniref:Phosphodiesterase n=1 Tax=Gilvimarinus gilvus TaxID=3058038 RepID=A0ABU4S3C4_9GAMM|nr:hypothetical protein [Gilvimarinus sp. SDUM040013]MDO3387158.1 hypothetical protein [Gilvimarinus sp. SDUM040013]MDX6850901.1 hypothetical protein [Gilvimarinus sp. SDUM040013]
MKRLPLYTLLPWALLMSLCATARADVVEIPIGEQTKQASITTPDKGHTKARVIQQFGDPDNTSGPVGEPAIYRWEYSNFVVYFENDWVIHSVVKFTPTVDPAS